MYQSADTAPENVVVMTKIADANGERNEQALRRRGNLWWTPDGEMYVYYWPTHWRELTATEREKERAFVASKSDHFARVVGTI